MLITSLRWSAIICFVVALSVQLLGGYYANKQVPPYPSKIQASDGKILAQKSDIMEGQRVFQRYGLMDHGSVWGHGSQRGMEFSATTVHIIGDVVRAGAAQNAYGKPHKSLSDIQKEFVNLIGIKEIKTNRYDPATDTLILSESQTKAFADVQQYWDRIFGQGEMRYGFLPNTIPLAQDRSNIATFFYWTAWAAMTNRPGLDYTYTNNWPADESVGNVPTVSTYMWSIGGIISLLLFLGFFIFLVHHYGIWYGPTRGVSLAEKMVDIPLTNSQFKAAKYFLVVILLFLVQTCFGGLLAHYTVHPGSFYIPLISKLIPYSWAKTWHLQLAIFWIATTWVASSIFLAPVVGGVEPRKQGLLVQMLFVAILVVAVGSLLGEIAGIRDYLGEFWFWVGHQGWEYLELGRAWQILLFLGLLAWLFIVYRSMAHHISGRNKDEFSSLVIFYVVSAILVVLFFAFGMFFGKETHLSVADYWRWYVVHIWVESIFEFFGVAAISLLLVSMGLVTARAALAVAYLTVALAFLSGILGTAHHYFWFGGPSYWLGIGSFFSSVEPVPLFGLIVRGLMEFRSISKEGKEFAFKWPLYFLVVSSFWNFLGAGVFGFIINLPIVNYYEHGTYLTVNHAHGALFGVYGMLSIGLLLFSWRGLVKREHWDDRILKISFWGFNGGLLLMTLGTLFPVGILQAWTSYQEGLWKARDASFFEGTLVQMVGTYRIIPDLIIIVVGVLPLAHFLFKTYPHLKASEIKEGESVWERLGIKR